MKHFLIINTSFFGDVLLTNPLCRNIKLLYPNSKITFIVNKPFWEVAKYSDGVDDVIIYDKKGKHKGIIGIWTFYQQYKNYFKSPLEVAFVIYGNERGIILAKLFGAKKVYAENKGIINILLDNPKNIDYHGNTKVQIKNSILLEQYTKNNIKNLPMKYVPPQFADDEIDILLKQLGINIQQQLIVICTTSKRKEKDMPVEDCCELITILKEKEYIPILVGAGIVAQKYVQELKLLGQSNFIDLVDKTTIAQLASLLKYSRVLISVDTGTMHLGLAVAIPTICLFYISTKEHLDCWAPEKEIYKCEVLTKNININEIMKSLNKIIR